MSTFLSDSTVDRTGGHTGLLDSGAYRKVSNSRVVVIDQLRGLALCLMIIFHGVYDLNSLGVISVEIHRGFYAYWRYLILTLFFLSVGASLYIAHSNSIDWKKFNRRLSVLAVAALMVTAVTGVVFPHQWVWFGTLHFIALASVATLPFLRYSKVSGVLGAGIIILFNTTEWFNLQWLYLAFQSVITLPAATVDLVRFIPWWGVVLIGVSVTRIASSQSVRYAVSGRQLPEILGGNLLSWLGKKSLMIYLTHQLVLFPIAGLVWLLLKR